MRIIFFILFCSINAFAFAQTKHALIVAIGNYPDRVKNKWKTINSLNDIPLIKNALVTNQHFDERNVRVLIDSQATKKGIIDALDQLLSTVNKGDIVVIHFSSHGQQIEDDNNDEIDGLDEAIVPYGAVFSSDPEKFEQLSPGYLRDDLFGDKIIQIRNKLGSKGDILVIIDACHSGSGTRGVETAAIRGGNIPMVSNRFNQGRNNRVDPGVFKDTTATRLNADASTFVLISGAQAREINYECYDDNGNPVGSLSYSFSKSISSLKENITYRGLFSLVENIMRDKAPNQKPVLEGDGIDKELFGGRYEKQQPYFTINSSQGKNDQVVLHAGFVSGITKGAGISFFKPGTSNIASKKPFNTGKVISVSAFSATVKLDVPDDSLNKMNPWAFVNELSFGAGNIKLFVRDIAGLAKAVQDSLGGFPLIEFDANCDLSLDTSGSVGNWALKYPNSGHVFQDGFSFPGESSTRRLKAALKMFARSRYLKNITLSEPGLSAKVELLFLDANGNVDSKQLLSRTQLGRREFREKDLVYLRIINSGNKQFYVNIVDIQPDGIINAVIPNKNLKDRHGNAAPVKWEDCLLKENDTLFLRNLSIEISKPYGEETFKVFLSSSPIDLEDILTSKDEGEAKTKRGILSELEKLFVHSNITMNTRGIETTRVNADESGTVFSLNFRIIPQ